MNKILICLTFALFLGAQAVVQREPHPLPPNPENLTQVVYDYAYATFLKEEQVAGRIPNATFTLVQVPYEEQHLKYYRTVEKYPGYYEYYFQFILTNTATKDTYNMYFMAKTDLENKTVNATSHKIIRSNIFSQWPGIEIIYDDSYNGDMFKNFTHLLKNNELAEVMFQKSLNATGQYSKLYNLPTIYHKLVSHKFTHFYVSPFTVSYSFLTTLQNLLTGETHEERRSVSFSASDINKTPIPEDFSAGSSVITPNFTYPVLNTNRIELRNTTALSYNPLPTLWNNTFLASLTPKAEKAIIKLVLRKYKKDPTGRFKIGQYPDSATIVNKGIVFSLGSSFSDVTHDWYRSVRAKFLFNPSTNKLTLVNTSVSPKWQRSPNFGQKGRKPQWW